MLLASYALQAEVGDYNQNVHGSDYFVPEHYLPQRVNYRKNFAFSSEVLVNSYSLSQVSRIRVGPKWVTKVNKSRVDGKSKDLGVRVFWVIGVATDASCQMNH